MKVFGFALRLRLRSLRQRHGLMDMYSASYEPRCTLEIYQNHTPYVRHHTLDCRLVSLGTRKRDRSGITSIMAPHTRRAACSAPRVWLGRDIVSVRQTSSVASVLHQPFRRLGRPVSVHQRVAMHTSLGMCRLPPPHAFNGRPSVRSRSWSRTIRKSFSQLP